MANLVAHRDLYYIICRLFVFKAMDNIAGNTLWRDIVRSTGNCVNDAVWDAVHIVSADHSALRDYLNEVR